VCEITIKQVSANATAA